MQEYSGSFEGYISPCRGVHIGEDGSRGHFDKCPPRWTLFLTLLPRAGFGNLQEGTGSLKKLEGLGIKPEASSHQSLYLAHLIAPSIS